MSNEVLQAPEPAPAAVVAKAQERDASASRTQNPDTPLDPQKKQKQIPTLQSLERLVEGSDKAQAEQTAEQTADQVVQSAPLDAPMPLPPALAAQVAPEPAPEAVVAKAQERDASASRTQNPDTPLDPQKKQKQIPTLQSLERLVEGSDKAQAEQTADQVAQSAPLVAPMPLPPALAAQVAPEPAPPLVAKAQAAQAAQVAPEPAPPLVAKAQAAQAAQAAPVPAAAPVAPEPVAASAPPVAAEGQIGWYGRTDPRYRILAEDFMSLITRMGNEYQIPTSALHQVILYGCDMAPRRSSSLPNAEKYQKALKKLSKEDQIFAQAMVNRFWKLKLEQQYSAAFLQEIRKVLFDNYIEFVDQPESVLGMIEGKIREISEESQLDPEEKLANLNKLRAVRDLLGKSVHAEKVVRRINESDFNALEQSLTGLVPNLSQWLTTNKFDLMGSADKDAFKPQEWSLARKFGVGLLFPLVPVARAAQGLRELFYDTTEGKKYGSGVAKAVKILYHPSTFRLVGLASLVIASIIGVTGASILTGGVLPIALLCAAVVGVAANYALDAYQIWKTKKLADKSARLKILTQLEEISQQLDPGIDLARLGNLETDLSSNKGLGTAKEIGKAAPSTVVSIVGSVLNPLILAEVVMGAVMRFLSIVRVAGIAEASEEAMRRIRLRNQSMEVKCGLRPGASVEEIDKAIKDKRDHLVEKFNGNENGNAELEKRFNGVVAEYDSLTPPTIGSVIVSAVVPGSETIESLAREAAMSGAKGTRALKDSAYMSATEPQQPAYNQPLDATKVDHPQNRDQPTTGVEHPTVPLKQIGKTFGIGV